MRNRPLFSRYRHWIVLSAALPVVIAMVVFESRSDSVNVEVTDNPAMVARSEETFDDDVAPDFESRAIQPEPIKTPQTTAHWVEVAAGDDPDARATAIAALASAPKADAIPVLQKILNGGIDADRQFALSSLHAIALHEGDADGEIRHVLRLAIYDGDDVIAGAAQVVLEDIEGEVPAL